MSFLIQSINWTKYVFAMSQKEMLKRHSLPFGLKLFDGLSYVGAIIVDKFKVVHWNIKLL